MRKPHSISSRLCLVFIASIFLMQGSIPNTGYSSNHESAGPSHTLAPSSLYSTQNPLLDRVMEIRKKRPVRAKIVGNWGANQAVKNYFQVLNPALADARNTDMVMAVPVTCIKDAAKTAGLHAHMVIGAQDISEERETGAYTGENVAQLVKQAGAKTVIIGHSDKRFPAPGKTESHATIAQKIKNARAQGMRVLLVIVETIDARRDGKTFEVIDDQIKNEYGQLTEEERAGVDIAYEPMWANEGNATPQQIEEVHQHIRTRLAEMESVGVEHAADTRILYAGNVTGETARSFLEQNNIDGFLVSKLASLDPEKFAQIAKAPGQMEKFDKGLSDLDRLLGETPLPQDQEIEIKIGNEVIAVGRWNEDEGVLKTVSVKPLVTRKDYQEYAGKMLAYLDEWTGKTQTKIQWQDKDGARIRWVLNDQTEAKEAKNNPGAKEAPLALDYVRGTKRWYGMERLLQIEYGGNAQRRPALLTLKETQSPATGGFEFIVQPKKTVLINGFGTIGSQVGLAARKAGFHVMAAQRSPNERAEYANLLGIPLFLSDPSKAAEFDEKEIKYGMITEKKWDGGVEVERFKPRTLEMLLLAGEVDVIVDATDGKTKYKDPATGKETTMKVAEFNKMTLYNKYPRVKIMYEGAEDPSIATGRFEAVTWLQAGKDLDIKEKDQSLFCPSCNTTMQLNLVGSLLGGMSRDSAFKGSTMEIHITTTRRTGDPGGGKSALPPDGIPVEIRYHHGEDVWDVLSDSLRDNIHMNEDGTMAFTTDASVGHQTKFHIGNAKFELHHPKGKKLTAKWVREQLEKTGRIAVVDFPKGKFDTSKVLDLIQNRIRQVHPFVGIAQVIDLGGGKIQVIFLTPQESNVIPNNVSAIQALTGVEKNTNRSIRFVNDVLDLTRMRTRLEQYLPTKERKITKAAEEVKRDPITESTIPLRSLQKNLKDMKREKQLSEAITREEISHGCVVHTINNPEDIKKLFGDEYPDKGETYQILEKDGQVFALARLGTNGILNTQTLFPEEYGWEYLNALMSYGDAFTRKTGKMIEIQDKDGELLQTLLNEAEHKTARAKSPGIREAGLSMGSLRGTRRWHGDENLLQIEYAARDLKPLEKASLMTVKDRDALSRTPVSFIIQPKKLVLVHGFETTGNELAHWARRAGFSVAVVLSDWKTSALNATLAGFPVYVADERDKLNFIGAGIPYEDTLVNFLTSSSTLPVHPIDVIVNATTGSKRLESKLVSEAQYYKEKVYDKHPRVKVLYLGSEKQGRNDRRLAEHVLDPATYGVAGIDQVIGGSGKGVLTSPPNADMQRTILAPLLKEFKNMEIDLDIKMSAANPGTSKQSAPADGTIVTTKSRDAADFLADLPGRLKNNIRTRDGVPAIYTTRMIGSQTKFHVVETTLKAPGLTAQRVKDILSQQSRLAIVDFADGKFDSSKFIDLFMNRFNLVHPMIGIAQVAPLGGNKIKITYVVPQESNVIPNNISALQILTGVVDGQARSVEFADRLIGLRDIKYRAEQFLPQESALELELHALRHEIRPRAMIAGNLKANPVKPGADTTGLMQEGGVLPDDVNRVALATEHLPKLQAGLGDALDVDYAILVPHDIVGHVAQRVGELAFGSNFKVGVEDISDGPAASATGEITANLAKQAGAQMVLIGHSERRTIYDNKKKRRERATKAADLQKVEKHDSIVRKIRKARAQGLHVILAVGETYDERYKENRTLQVIENQLMEEYGKLTPDERKGVTIAYEPVWAIGEGAKPCPPEEAEKIHLFIRLTIARLAGVENAARTRILYGGNVKPDNIASYLAQENIDGALVGGASLVADEFVKIGRAPLAVSRFKQTLSAATEAGSNQRFYSRIASDYARSAREIPQAVAEHRERFRQLLEISHREGPILDPGTAVGINAEWFVAQGRKTIGVDSSSAMIDKALLRQTSPNVEYRVGDLRNLDLGDRRMAGIWDNETFDHFPESDAKAVLGQYGRVIDPGGLLFIRVQKGHGTKFGIDPKYSIGNRYTKFWQQDELRSFVESGGFEVLQSGEDDGTSLSAEPSGQNKWVYVLAWRPTEGAVKPDVEFLNFQGQPADRSL